MICRAAPVLKGPWHRDCDGKASAARRRRSPPANPRDARRKGPAMSAEHSADLGSNVSAQDAKLIKARRRVAAIKGFYVHVFIFAFIMLGLGALNLAVGGPWWVLWVLLGWGLGVVAHALSVFGRTSKRIADWEDRKIRQLMSEG